MLRQWLDCRDFMHNMFILLCKEMAHRMCVLQTGIILQISVSLLLLLNQKSNWENNKYYRLVSWNKNIIESLQLRMVLKPFRTLAVEHSGIVLWVLNIQASLTHFFRKYKNLQLICTLFVKSHLFFDCTASEWQVRQMILKKKLPPRCLTVCDVMSDQMLWS